MFCLSMHIRNNFPQICKFRQIVVKHTLVSGTAANEPVTHTLTVSHHELLMSLSWLTVVKLKKNMPVHQTHPLSPLIVLYSSLSHTQTQTHSPRGEDQRGGTGCTPASLIYTYTYIHMAVR